MVRGIDDVEVLAQLELLQDQRIAEKHLALLVTPDKAWQPADLLPDLSRSDWDDQLRQFRRVAGKISDQLLVVLVGGLITEEALPNYAISLNLIARDATGDSPDPWARWMRSWIAEENRHGDVLNGYLRLSGRVDMRSVEVTIHHLISSGFNPRAFPDPYAGLIYTAFQERATRIAHSNVGGLAAGEGDEALARICQRVAGDESRHEQFYTRVVGEIVSRDPERAILIFRKMMKRIITMPGKLMHDGQDAELFDHYATVAQRLGVYTAHDYAGIVGHLVKTWGIADIAVSGKAAAAQEFLCVQAERLGSLADTVMQNVLGQPPVPFRWLHERVA
jgi:acyl-[acyl-carrier-protein] desaturase